MMTWWFVCLSRPMSVWNSFNMQFEIPVFPQNFSGLVLLSNPQVETCWDKVVMVVIKHSQKTGAIGLQLNRPSRLNLGDFNDKNWESFGNIPVFLGGPNQMQKLMITAFDWHREQQLIKWRLGLSPKQAYQLVCDYPAMNFRAYCGHISWKSGQLEEELKNKIWLPIPVPQKKLFAQHPQNLWQDLMSQFYPLGLFFKQLPKNPSLN